MSKTVFEKWIEVEEKSIDDNYILEYYLSQKTKRGLNESRQKNQFTGGHILYGYIKVIAYSLKYFRLFKVDAYCTFT